MFFLGGGKCLNLKVVNVRILGVVNVLLANDSKSSEHTKNVQFLSDSSLLIGLGNNSQTNSLTSKIDISVSKLLGFETFANVFRVSVSENMVSEKKFQFQFQKIWSRKKALVSVS